MIVAARGNLNQGAIFIFEKR